MLIGVTWLASDAIYGHSHPLWWHFIFKDAKYYLAIAEHGYKATSPFPWGRGSEPDRRTAFFPLFPAVIRLFGYLTAGHDVIAGFIVQVLSGAASALGVWGLAARARDRRTADRAVLLYCLFPGAMTFGLLYAEPLAIALSAAVLMAHTRPGQALPDVGGFKAALIIAAALCLVTALVSYVLPGRAPSPPSARTAGEEEDRP